MSFTITMKTHPWGSIHLTTMAFASDIEAAEFATDANARWPDLVAEWKVIETSLAPTHRYSKAGGLTPITPEEP